MGQSRWQTGEAEVQNLIDSREIELVAASPEHAALLMDQAHVHLQSATALLDSDPTGAYALIYDGARKSLSAALAQQCLRATAKNGHRATQEAIEAQLGPSARRVIRPFRGLRLRRHDAEYPALSTPPITQAEAYEAHGDASEIVAGISRFLPSLGAWAE